MYHEVSKNLPPLHQFHTITPLYNIPVKMFEDQLRLLSERGYHSFLFEDLAILKENQKYVMLTFDDGLKGNYHYALPLLEKYGFKAIFFVNVGSINSEHFMDWKELLDLVKHGMSVQSHALSHRPLQTLGDEEVYKELTESKRIIEEKLNTEVTALSFPHGSYNQKIARFARQVGYKYLFGSDIERIYASSLQKNQNVLGRIALTNKLDTKRFLCVMEYKRTEIIRQKLEKLSKNTLKKIIGIENYRYLYRKYFNIRKTT